METIIHENKEFKQIEKGKGFYYICKETSEILSMMRPNAPKVLKQVVNGNGYYMVGFFTKADRINVNVHRALMETFIGNPQQLPHINHIDGNKCNNTLSNLEWCTAKHNTEHAHRTGLATNAHCKTPVYRYTLKGEYIDTFKSIHEAARANGTSAASIHHTINGKQKTAAGCLWTNVKHPFIEATNLQIADYYILDDKVVKSMQNLCLLLNTTRASIHRRFNKFGNSFVMNNKTVTRVFCN